MAPASSSPVCGATIEGPQSHGSRRGIRTWRKRCKARPMRARPDLAGYEPGRCFQHQPSEVRNAVYAEADARKRKRRLGEPDLDYYGQPKPW